MSRRGHRRTTLAVYLLLIGATLAVYGRATGHDFIALDDPEYVVDNARVNRGLTADGLAWAFTTFQSSSWQPVTWLSHMLDVQIFGLEPGGHHATSIALHVLNVLILFRLLLALTGKLRPSAVIAALFAVHPLNVEAVAWVAGRKHLLGVGFGLLSLLAYTAYARRGGSRRYAVCALFLALGLMAKSVVVTLPCVFLLLDYWPLRRFGNGKAAAPVRLVIEKLPFFAISIASGVVTYGTQHAGGAITETTALALRFRVLNALVSYGMYLWKGLFPVDLSVLYPHPYLPGGTPWETWQIAAAAVVLAAITVFVIRSHRRFVKVGWLWFAGTLVPTAGIVQFGWHGMADRFAYLPMVGVFIFVTWSARRFAVAMRGRPQIPRVFRAAVVFVLAGYAGLAYLQLGYWKNSVTLFEHSLAAAPGASALHINLGNELVAERRLQAIEHYRMALELVPGHTDAHANLGFALVQERRYAEALPYLESVARTYAEHAAFRYNLALALRGTGRPLEAAGEFRAAASLSPDWAEPRVQAAWIVATQPDASPPAVSEAVALAEEAVRLTRQTSAAALDTLAAAYAAAGRFDEAIPVARQAIHLLETGQPPGSADTIRRRLETYQRGQPYRKPTGRR